MRKIITVNYRNTSKKLSRCVMDCNHLDYFAETWLSNGERFIIRTKKKGIQLGVSIMFH